MTPTPDFTFPADSRSELDRVLDELMMRAREVQLTQGRLRALLRANQLVVEQLDLPVLLTRVVDAAITLVGADYGALGVLLPGGEQRLIHAGDAAFDAAALEHPPEGPTLLRVPIRVREAVYGTLYLRHDGATPFTGEDEQLIAALAATAGIAIENARLYSETRMRQAWSAASAEITAAMLSAHDGDAVEVLADRVRTLANAAVVCVLVPTPSTARLAVATARGLEGELDAGTLPATAASAVHGVLEGGHPRLVDQGEELGLTLASGRLLGPAMVVPLVTAGGAKGVLLVARLQNEGRYGMADLSMAAGFADQASLAMELYGARADQQRMSLLEDRGRIARDLHDHVIQQLFATGLALDSVARALPAGTEADRIGESVEHLDAAISQIRTAIFALDASDGSSVKRDVIDLVHELAAGFERVPSLTFSGPVDLMITDLLARDVLAVAREGMTNIARHAQADNAGVSLSVADGHVMLEIRDDGRGMAGGGRHRGLTNLEMRATRRGGRFDIESDADGTRLQWSVPVLVDPEPVST